MSLENNDKNQVTFHQTTRSQLVCAIVWNVQLLDTIH